MKRFTATEKWDKSWHRRLPCKLKCLWDYLCAKCDSSGVWEADWELASFQIGEPVSENDMQIFEDRVELLGSGKWFISGFCQFQYGTLSEACRGQTHVFNSLRKHKLLDRVLNSLSNRVSDTPKEKEKEKEPDSPPYVAADGMATDGPNGEYTIATELAIAFHKAYGRTLTYPTGKVLYNVRTLLAQGIPEADIRKHIAWCSTRGQFTPNSEETASDPDKWTQWRRIQEKEAAEAPKKKLNYAP